jgi:hypothetical protein
MKKAANIFLLFVLVLVTAWCAMALFFVPPAEFRNPAGITFLILIFASLFSSKHRKKLVWGLCFAVIAWHLSLKPTNYRDWSADNMKIPSITIEGDKISVKNVRNFKYVTEDNFTPIFDDREYDLSKIESVDLVVVYWGMKAIAHTMLSFGFKDGQYLTFSVETRKAVGAQYSALKGFFKVYELIYIAGDERDLIRVRSNFRKEDVYLYRLVTPPGRARKIFLDYIQKADRLDDTPEFYNALDDNCTTNLFKHFEDVNPALKFDYRVLLNGYIDEMTYELGGFKTKLPFPEYKKISLINDLALEAHDSPDFSKIIRKRFNDK